MSLQSTLGFGIPRLVIRDGSDTQLVMIHRPLRRVLDFLGYDIDDVCNDWLAKNKVAGFYKLYREIQRTGEISDLERQWNPTGV